MSLSLTLTEILIIGASLFAILMVGSSNLRTSILLYFSQTSLIAFATAAEAYSQHHNHLFLISLVILLVKAIGVSYFLSRILSYVQIYIDPGTILPVPIAMHASIALLALARILSYQIPIAPGLTCTTYSITAAISLVFTGMLFMLTRRAAISQVIGFITMENGIFLVALTIAQGMPMLVEFGVLLDVLVGVMIAGLITFRIKKSFEHIDVTRLTDLKE